MKVCSFDRVDSTQAKAWELAEQGAPEGTVILANTQTAGRGRWGRTWLSPRGGLWASLVLRPTIRARYIPLLGLAMALSISRALDHRFGLKAGIKWPNDVLVKERKIAGILTEASLEGERVAHVILGVGVNVNNTLNQFPRPLRKSVTTVARELRRRVAKKPLLETILTEFDHNYRWLATGDIQRLLHEVRSSTLTLGRPVKVEQEGFMQEGEATDLDSTGRLVLRLRDGSTKCFYAGEVVHLKQ